MSSSDSVSDDGSVIVGTSLTTSSSASNRCGVKKLRSSSQPSVAVDWLRTLQVQVLAPVLRQSAAWVA
jgi:uncharacterized membrane protein